MSEVPRCIKCTRKYASGGTYKTPLSTCYIRKGAQGRQWIKIEYLYCPDCNEIYQQTTKKENKDIQLKTGLTSQ